MKDRYKYGIGFWIGAGILSLVNMFQNLKQAPQHNILIYTYYMTGISVFGLILNIILLKREREKKHKNL
jgi:hypothetical protein